MTILRAVPLIAAMMSSPAWAGVHRCINARVEDAMGDFEAALPGRGRELVDSGSQGFSVSGVLGVRIYAEPGYTYEAYMISPERSHLSFEVFDEGMVPFSKYEAPSSFTIKHSFRTKFNKAGYYVLSVGSLSGTPTRCVYYTVSRKPLR
jgi:hypothetical protein